MSLSRWRQQYRSFLTERGLEDNDKAFSGFLLAKRRMLIGLPSKGRIEMRARKKRAYRRAKTKILKSIYLQSGVKRRTIPHLELVLYRPKDDPLRDALVPDFLEKWTPFSHRLRNKKPVEINLNDFSFATNPDGTLEKLKNIALACASAVDVRINFIDQSCEDVAPYIVLAHLLRSLPRVISGGNISLDIIEMVEAVGLHQHLHISAVTNKKNKNEVLPFHMLQRIPPDKFGDLDHQLRPQYKELVADHFCSTLASWLAKRNLELRAEAEASITSCIGEALDNAERHGLIDVDEGLGDWSLAGFSRLVDCDDGRKVLQCSVAMISIGETISSSLTTAAPSIAAQLDGYVRHHVGLRGGDVRRELLRTVAALQDGITRVATATAAGRGGVGLMELTSLFADLGETEDEGRQSVFTIISGNSCLRITHPFRRGVHIQGQGRQMWFNDENSPLKPPSAEHVFSLRSRFPGAILSACFTVDPDHMRQKQSDDDSANG